MRAFINFFLVAYALDAVISTLDDTALVLFGMHIMGPVRNTVGLAVFLLCVAVYLSLGIDSRLPKRVLLPPVLLGIWAGLGSLPLPIFFEDGAVFLTVSLLQLALSVFAFLSIRNISGGRWLLPPAFFDRPVFRLKNTALFASINIILLPVAGLLLLATSAKLYVEEETNGFMQLGAEGLSLQERTYTRGDKTIHLVAMIHIGTREYYEELSEYLSRDDIIVLAEGVADKTGLIGRFPAYSRVAELTGLVAQQEMALYGKLLEYEQLKELHDEDSADPREPIILRADIDSRALSERTLAFIHKVGELLAGKRPLVESFSDYMDWYSENMTPEEERAVMNELIHERNDVLLDYLDKVLPYYDIIVVPWGALHMPGLEQAVLEKGFTPGEHTSRLAVGYRRLLQSMRQEDRAE